MNTKPGGPVEVSAAAAATRAARAAPPGADGLLAGVVPHPRVTSRKIEKDLLPFEVVDTLDGLGKKVSIARRVRGWTQADLAGKAGVGLNTLGEVEKGSPSVQFGHWLKVLWALDQMDILEMAACPEDDALTQALLVRRLPRRVRDQISEG